ncbi:MAG: hypothetical protein ABSB60_11225 [Terracidiphilus sp.]|jgi:hypothetical protein
MSQNAEKEMGANGDDMRPEYDFSRGLRGVHAYRFSKLSSDEALILRYWQGKGFEVGSFAKNEMRDFKTPDFRLSLGGVEVALCEVKSFQRDLWLEDQLKNAPDGELAGGLRPDPIFNRICNAVHTAFKQFDSVNSDHRLLNFLFLVNHDTCAKPDDLDRVLTGYENPRMGPFEPTCAQFAQGRIREEKHKIDLYVWFDSRIKSREYFVLGSPKTQERVCELLKFDLARVKKLSSAT